MAPQTRTYTSTRTRTEAVVDQFEIFLKYCMVDEQLRELVLLGVNKRWVSTAAAYITDANSGKRILEAFVQVDWVQHSDLARLTPTVVVDLPGWEDGAAPEISVLGRRFGREALARQRPVRCWVELAPEIRNNSSLKAKAERELNIGGSVPDWQGTPYERVYPLPDLPEQQAGIRST